MACVNGWLTAHLPTLMYFTNHVTYQINSKLALNIDLILNSYVGWKKPWSNMRDMTIIPLCGWESGPHHFHIHTRTEQVSSLQVSCHCGSGHLLPSATGRMFESDSNAPDSSLHISGLPVVKHLFPSAASAHQTHESSGTLARKQSNDCTYYEK